MVKKRPFLMILIGAAVAGVWRGAVAWAAQLPNIVIIMADDMGFSDAGCYGGEVRTPHIDALAARGLRFTQFYNNAVCCPTRASLLTGLYPQQAGMGWMVHHGSDDREPGPYQGYLNQHCVTLAEVLSDAGYRTLMAGKWHVGENRPHWPTDRGFQRYFGLISGAANYFDIRKTKNKGMKRQMARDDQPYDPPADGFYMTDAITEAALAFLDESSDEQKPFFLYVAYTAPHCPLHAPPEEIAAYQGRFLDGWDDLRRQRLQNQKRLGLFPPSLELAPDDPQVEPWSASQDPALMDLKMAIYAAQITRMDTGIGKILDAIDQSGKSENTLILFLSDNGACKVERISDHEQFNVPPYLGGEDSYDAYGRSWARLSNAPLRGYKAGSYEGGIATPLIAVWPGVITNAGSFSDQVGHVMDLMPTILEIAGCDYPTTRHGQNILPPEGVSLLPALQGGHVERNAPLFWEFEGHRAVRDGQWKLVCAPDGDWQLFDLQNDRTERNDLAAQMPQRVASMAQAYAQWAERCGVLPWKSIEQQMTNIDPTP